MSDEIKTQLAPGSAPHAVPISVEEMEMVENGLKNLAVLSTKISEILRTRIPPVEEFSWHLLALSLSANACHKQAQTILAEMPRANPKGN